MKTISVVAISLSYAVLGFVTFALALPDLLPFRSHSDYLTFVSIGHRREFAWLALILPALVAVHALAARRFQLGWLVLSLPVVSLALWLALGTQRAWDTWVAFLASLALQSGALYLIVFRRPRVGNG